MFTHIMERSLPESQGETLWEQCREELMRVNGSFAVEEVDRLAKLVSHRLSGDFKLLIQEVASETINGFMEDLPF